MHPGKDRKLNRWYGNDYSLPGWYFVTICTQNRVCCLGEIVEGRMVVKEAGEIARDFFTQIPKYFVNCELDQYIIMPNHIHGILHIFYNDEEEHRKIVRDADLRPLRNTGMYLSKIIHQFKSSVSREIRQNAVSFAWHRSFHDRIIRNEQELINMREYIKDNPTNWPLS